MPNMRYFGRYIRFDTESKRAGIFLLNADNLIGDEYTISFEVENGKTRAWLKNKFDNPVGFFNERDTYQLDVLRARDWKLHALLSVVMYSETEEQGMYWGEMAVIAHPERYDEEISTYLEMVHTQLVEGIRPAIELTEDQIDTMLAEKGAWVSPSHIAIPKKDKNTAAVKTTQSLSEKMIEQGRAGNKGCYAVSYAFLAVLIAGACFFAAKLLGFL